MHTIVLITNSAKTESDLVRLLGVDHTVIVRSIPVENHTAALDEIPSLLRNCDLALVDVISLGHMSQKIVGVIEESASESLPIIARVTPSQIHLARLPDDWALTYESDTPHRLRYTAQSLIERRDLRFRVEQLQRSLAQQQQLLDAAREWAQTERVRGYVSISQYRDALKNLSRLFSNTHDITVLADQFLALLRELLGLSKLALFLRPMPVSLSTTLLSSGSKEGIRYNGIAAIGLPAECIRAMRLSDGGGIGKFVAAEGRILRRNQLTQQSAVACDLHVGKEFEILNAEFAMPIQDNETTLGILTFNGKITGEDVTADDLEFLFALCGTLASAVKKIWLADQVSHQQRFTADVLAHVQSGVVVLNQQAQIALANPRLFELLGMPAADATGRDIAWLPPQIGEALFATLRTGIAQSRLEVKVPQTQQVISMSTSRFAASANGAGSGPQFFVAGVLDDVTRAKQEETRAQEARHAAFILQLAASLSHELKNAMSPMQSYAQLLPERLNDPAFLSDFSQKMQSNVERVVKVVDNINFFANPLELKLEPIAVTDFIEQCISKACAEVWESAGLPGNFSGDRPTNLVNTKGKTLTIQRMFNHTAPSLTGDKKHLEQAIIHLLRNAIQAMETVGGRLAIATEDITQNESSPMGIKISITDTGIGIPLSDLEKIFEPFYTTKLHGAVGLGLPIVKKSIAAHRGRVEINSKLGKGTTMQVLLPISRDVDLTRANTEISGNGQGGLTETATTAPSYRFQPPKRTEL